MKLTVDFATYFMIGLILASFSLYLFTSIKSSNELARECEPYHHHKTLDIPANCLHYFSTEWLFIDPDITNHDHQENDFR